MGCRRFFFCLILLYYQEEYEKWGLAMNLEKTKYICIGEEKKSKI
jgi:hypothetical protein